MKFHYSLIFVLLSLSSCSSGIMWYERFHPDAALLESAYQSGSYSKVDTFFNHWVGNEKSISETEYLQLSDTIKIAYEVLEALYDSIKFSPIYNDSKYRIVKARPTIYIVRYIITNVIQRAQSKDTNFTKWPDYEMRPRLHFQNNKIVYLTPMYDSLLMSFLAGPYSLTSGFENTSALKGEEPSKRNEFIERYARFTPGHWGWGWSTPSYPVVHGIVLNQRLDSALVSYSHQYSIKSVVMSKTFSKWNIGECVFQLVE